jgi:glycosyltransferase involved in cell wall biosynthesis
VTGGKRPDVFVEVVRSLRNDGTDLRALLVGDGPLRQVLEEPARVAGVELLGERTDVAELMRDADLMIFPSLPEGEGMPGVLIEAGLSGLCVVATDVPGASAVIEDGVTGSIVGITDIAGLLGQARKLLSDGARRRAMGQAARDRCNSLFSMETSASAWSTLLERVGMERVGR